MAALLRLPGWAHIANFHFFFKSRPGGCLNPQAMDPMDPGLLGALGALLSGMDGDGGSGGLPGGLAGLMGGGAGGGASIAILTVPGRGIVGTAITPNGLSAVGVPVAGLGEYSTSGKWLGRSNMIWCWQVRL